MWTKSFKDELTKVALRSTTILRASGLAHKQVLDASKLMGTKVYRYTDIDQRASDAKWFDRKSRQVLDLRAGGYERKAQERMGNIMTRHNKPAVTPKDPRWAWKA